MKVVGGASTLRAMRAGATENGMPCQTRVSRGRSNRSSCRNTDLPGGLGKPVVGRRVTGEPLEPDAATRNAERPKGEKRELASRLPGNSYGRFWGGRREKGRASGTSPAAYPTWNIRSQNDHLPLPNP